MRPWTVSMLLLGLGGAVGLVGCGQPGPAVSPARAADSWLEFADSPLSPRVSAVGLWTGREVLLIGGRNGNLCPPNASCHTDGTPLADGAALDPATGSWRRIAEAPVPLEATRGVVISQTAYFVVPDAGTGLLTYQIDEDRWQWLPVPFGSAGWYELAVAGDQLVAYLSSDAGVTGQDYLFDHLVAFGGVDWSANGPRLSNQTWIWSPPAAT